MVVCHFCSQDLDFTSPKLNTPRNLFRCCLVFTEGFEISLQHPKHNIGRTLMYQERESSATNPTWGLNVISPKAFYDYQTCVTVNASKSFQCF